MSFLAPIILFVYNRPTLTQQTVQALQDNILASQSHLIIYSDGPHVKNDPDVAAVRSYIRTITGFKSIDIKERDKNYGLAKNIIEGVTATVNNHQKAIILEDDLITSKFFLQYMNDALAVYENDENVWSIGACNFFIDKASLTDSFFSPIPDTWGWATWKSRWDNFEENSEYLYKELERKNLKHSFNINGKYPFTHMLKQQSEGKISSWAIRWQASAYLHNAYTLYPKYSLTRIIESSQGTHQSNFTLDKYLRFPDKRLSISKSEVKILKSVEKAIENNFTRVFPNKKKKTQFNMIKKVIYNLTPPVFGKIVRKFVKQKKNIQIKKAQIEWTGNYKNWQEAISESKGYDDAIILETVRNAILKVKNGEAPYERDSVLFDKIQHNWPLLSCLQQIAINKGNELNLIDFGGSLGSTYFQNRQFLNSLNNVSWTVVEQPNFVECGQKEISDKQLKFHFTIDDVMKKSEIDVLLASGVIQCLDKPYEWLNQFLEYNFEYLIIDRTAFIEGEKDRLTVQSVPPQIYDASYPSWFLNEKKFLSYILNKYILLADFESFADEVSFMEDGARCYRKGFFFKRK